MDKIKVMNPQKFDVGVVTQDRPLGINIKAGSFLLLTEDEIAYIASVSTLFQHGILRVDRMHNAVMESVGINPEENPYFVVDEDIRKALGLSAKKIQEWLAPIDEGHILDRVYDIAKEMNLNMSKVRVLQEKMPERDFLA